VRLLRVLRPPEPGRRLRPLARGRVREDRRAARVGGDLVGFNGGFNPRLPLDYYCDLFAAVRERYGDAVEFYALTVAEFVFLADRARLSYADAAARLRDAGVHWITGGGSEILTEDFRKRHAKWKYTVATTSRRSARSSRAACARRRRW
jgi:2-iminoacetate synthase ThiH